MAAFFPPRIIVPFFFFFCMTLQVFRFPVLLVYQAPSYLALRTTLSKTSWTHGKNRDAIWTLLHRLSFEKLHLATFFFFQIGICLRVMSASSRVSRRPQSSHRHPPHPCLVLRTEVLELGRSLSFPSLMIVILILLRPP